MNEVENRIVEKFKALLLRKGNVHRIILFGSRARGDAGKYSDMDVVVILDESAAEQDFEYVSDCAWEAGFEYGIVVVPVVFTRQEW
ncbi:MAG: nucleotidyltransferase domain-containing protein [Thermodesulfovibrionales bacterium]